jgi:putative ABC transport system permease protein
MFRNYFKIAMRNLWKRKAFTSLNIVGLSIAFGIAILLCSAALFDLSYDQFHKNLGSIYKIYTSIQTPKGGEENQSNPVPMTPAIKTEVPGIQKISRYNGSPALVIYNEKELNLSVSYVDKDFFSIFSFPAIKGNLQTPLVNKTDVVVTEKGAEKLFGTTDVVGKTLLINIEDQQKPFTVSAVLKDLPLQSSFQFDAAINFENNPYFSRDHDNWTSFSHDIYVQLDEHVAAEQFEKSTVAFTNLHFKNDIDNSKRDGIKADANGQYRQIRLLPYSNVHFTKFQNGIATVNKARTYMISGIALLILLIACVNFVNMSIGTSVQRLREIGMRKTLGAEKRQLFFQFWGESILIFLSAVCIGLLISSLLSEQFKTLFRIQASLTSVATPSIIISFIISIFIITLIAGGYPAMLLSKLGTLQSLKGKLDASRSNRLRNALIVVQFSIAILLISGNTCKTKI